MVEAILGNPQGSSGNKNWTEVAVCHVGLDGR